MSELNLSANTITAAVLHDLLEDSKVTSKQIEKNFNKEVAGLVEAVSFNPYIKDKAEQYVEMFIRTKGAGFLALAIKCADLLDNSKYYKFGKSKTSEKILVDKLTYFVKIAESELKDFSLYKELKKKKGELIKEFNKLYKK